MREIVKYRAHPSIIVIKKNCNASTLFNFSFEDEEDILKEIKKLKAIRQHKILTFQLN